MNLVKSSVFILLIILLISKAEKNNLYFNKFSSNIELDTILNDTLFVNVKTISNDFTFDLKYATNNNFLHKTVYECDDCYLRKITAKSINEANKDFLKLGYRIKFFDCYRPLDIQKKMWKIVSNPNYVADPLKGSMHNRGGAVDITLVDSKGRELNMGTKFDFFGKKSSHSYIKFSKQIIKNRILLKTIMERHHFKALNSEWWHYNLDNGSDFSIANFKWDCK